MEGYWEEKERLAQEDAVHRVASNPEQFGDQQTLFHAPLGQPEGGVFKGNPSARLYRTYQVPDHLTDPHDILDHLSQGSDGRDVGIQKGLGLHWQHDRTFAEDLGQEVHSGNWGGHGVNAHPVIVEADHPGLDHVLTYDSVKPGSRDQKVLEHTVGEEQYNSAMLPEVTPRPGAALQVHAVHTPDPTTSGAWIRNPVQFKGIA